MATMGVIASDRAVGLASDADLRKRNSVLRKFSATLMVVVLKNGETRVVTELF